MNFINENKRNQVNRNKKFPEKIFLPFNLNKIFAKQGKTNLFNSSKTEDGIELGEWAAARGLTNPADFIKWQTASNYNLKLEDAYTLILTDNISANTITVPDDSTVNFKVGTVIDIAQIGAGTTSIIGLGGVTINSIAGFTSVSDRYAMVALTKIDANRWLLIGSLA